MPFLLSNQQRQSTESTRYVNVQAADCLIIAVANGQRQTDHNANCATASAPHQQPPPNLDAFWHWCWCTHDVISYRIYLRITQLSKYSKLVRQITRLLSYRWLLMIGLQLVQSRQGQCIVGEQCLNLHDIIRPF